MSLHPYSGGPTVSAMAVIDLANELLEREYATHDYLLALSPELAQLYVAWRNNEAVHELRLPEELFIQLWQRAELCDEDGGLGLKIGSKVNHQSKGILANWLFQCGTLDEAFSTFSQNIVLLNPSEHWQKTEHNDEVTLTVRFASRRYPAMAIDRSMAAILSWSSALSQEAIAPKVAKFVRSAPDSIEKYQSVFGGNLIFGQEENALVLPKQIFHQAVKASNPYLKELVAKQAKSISVRLSNKRSFAESVNALLHKDLEFFCQIGATCAALHVSRSTLYRKLKAEGTSFTQLLKGARLTKLRSGVGQFARHEDLAQELGFQDIGSYYRFRKQNS